MHSRERNCDFIHIFMRNKVILAPTCLCLNLPCVCVFPFMSLNEEIPSVQSWPRQCLLVDPVKGAGPENEGREGGFVHREDGRFSPPPPGRLRLEFLRVLTPFSRSFAVFLFLHLEAVRFDGKDVFEFPLTFKSTFRIKREAD